MKITVGPSSIKELFESNNNVEVPNFQRNYVWEKENVEQLLKDALEAAELGDSHFFGPIVLLKNDSDFEVIDGQQRVTTAVMTLAILRDILLDKRYFPATEQEFIDTYQFLIRGILYKQDAQPKPKFRAGYLIRRFFDEGVLPIDSKKTKNATKKGVGLGAAEINDTKELRKIYLFVEKFLRARLEGLDLDSRKSLMEQLFKGLSESFQIHSMVVEDEFDAYRLFESINYLGIKLEPSDLLKSLTLRKIQKSKPDKLERALEDWDSFIKNLGGYNVSKYLRHYLLSTEKNKVQASRIFPIFKGKLDGGADQALDVLKNLVSSSKNYGILLNKSSVTHANGDINKIALRLNYLGDTHRILLLMILESKLAVPAQVKAFRAAEYLVFRNVSARANRQETEDLYRKLGQDLQALDKEDSAGIDAWCEAIFAKAATDEFLREFTVNNTENLGIQYDPREDIARYVLAVLTDDIDDFIVTDPTLEHLAPQTPAADSNWKTQVPASPDIYDVQIRWWGNLTWLENSLNSKIQNKVWTQKLNGNPNNNIDGLNKSKFVLTERVCLKAEWTSAEIRSRGDWMLNTFLELRGKNWVLTGNNNAAQVALW